MLTKKSENVYKKGAYLKVVVDAAEVAIPIQKNYFEWLFIQTHKAHLQYASLSLVEEMNTLRNLVEEGYCWPSYTKINSKKLSSWESIERKPGDRAR